MSSHKDPFQAEDQFLGVFTTAQTGDADAANAPYAPLRVSTTTADTRTRTHRPDTFHEDRFPARQRFLQLHVDPEDVVAATVPANRTVTHTATQVLDWNTVAAMVADPAAAADTLVMATATPVSAGDAPQVGGTSEKEAKSKSRRRPSATRPAVTATTAATAAQQPPSSQPSSAPSEETGARPAATTSTAATVTVTVSSSSLPANGPHSLQDADDGGFVLLQTRQRRETEARRAEKSRLAAEKAAADERRESKTAKKAGKELEGEAEKENVDGHGPSHHKRRSHRKTTTQARGDADDVVVEDASADSDAAASVSSLPDYDPDDGGALLAEARARQAHGARGGDAAVDAAVAAAVARLPGEDDYVRLPFAFQQGPIPYWLQRTSELLLTQNTLGGYGAGSGELPVDTVLRRLRADVQEARALLWEVGVGKDERPFRTRPALATEQYDGHCNPYAPPTSAAEDAAGSEDVRTGAAAITSEEADREEEMNAPTKSAAALVEGAPTVVAMDVLVDEASNDVPRTAPEALTAQEAVSPVKKKNMAAEALARAAQRKAMPLLTPEEEQADRARPVLEQTIPLWRYRGAARTALTELIDLLESRIALLEKRLDNDHDALVDGGASGTAWRFDAVGLPQQFGALGGPGSDGVDGRQSTDLPPAVEHAYASTMANTLMSDLFTDPRVSAFTDRTARVADAFYAQLPAIHARYLVDERVRPVYDPTRTLRPAQALPDSDDWLTDIARHMTAGGGQGTATEARQSYSIHIDYIRFHPAKSYTDVEKVLLGRHSATPAAAPVPAAADTRGCAEAGGVEARGLLDAGRIMGTPRPTRAAAAAAAGGGGIVLPISNTSFASSLLTDLDRALPTSQPLSASVSWLLVQALAVSAATRLSPIPFSLESFFVAHLMHHYEQYRLLILNLHPDIKSRHFYAEQIEQLEGVKSTLVRGESDKAVLVEEVEPLLQQLWSLCESAMRWERHHVKRMAEMWNMILIVRGQPPLPEESEGDRQRRRHTNSSNNSNHYPRGSQGGNGGRRRRGGSGSSSSWPWSSSASTTSPSLDSGADGPVPDASLRTAAAAPHRSERRTTIDSPGVFASSDGSGGGGSDGFFTPRGAAAATAAPVPGEPSQTAVDAGATTTITTIGATGASALFDSPTPWRQSAGGRPALEGNMAADSFLFAVDDPFASGEAAHGQGGEGEGEGITTGPTPVGVSTSDSAPASSFRFYLVPRTGRREAIAYVPDLDDLLDFAPVVEGVDVTQREPLPASSSDPSTASLTSPAITSGSREGSGPRSEASGDSGSGPHRHHHGGGGGAGLGEMRFFQAAVFVRSSAAMPPQYVGSTMPRPLTRTNTLFFNETFEMRALQEPQEVLLHILPVSTARTQQRRVLATVRVQPTLARRYRLFPLESPVSFVFHGQLIARVDAGHGASARTPVGGVLAASTTWTSWRGLTLEQAEQVFLRCQADPLDPANAPVLRQLRNYYAEVERNRREATIAEAHARRARDRRVRRERRMAVTLSPPPRRTSSGASQARGERATSAGGCPLLLGQLRTPSLTDLTAARKTSQREQQQQQSSSSSRGRHRRGRSPRMQTDDDVLAEAEYDASRLACLRKRWLVSTRKAAVEGEMEARLYRYPIPLISSDARELIKFLEREMETEARARRKSYRNLDLDEDAYNAGPASSSGLALSPLPKSVKLRLWQKRLEMAMLTRRLPRDVSDTEKLAAVVTLPKLSLRLAAIKPPRSRLNPERKERPKTETIDRATYTNSSRLVFHIMKAMNLPRRADGTPLEPFVEVGFVYETAYSRCELGTSPSWFQTLELPFEPPSLDEETLDMIDDDLCIAIYDKVEVAMPSTTHGTGIVAHETHYRTERRLLATLRIPFYSLHKAESARMEGVYPLRVSRWLLGYKMPDASDSVAGAKQGAADALRDQNGGEARPNPFASQSQLSPATTSAAGGTAPDNTAITIGPGAAARTLASAATTPTIQLYLSLWPPLQRDKPAKTSDAALVRRVHGLNVSSSLRVLHDVALKWSKSAASKIKSIATINPLANDRELEPFVFCSSGDLMLVCRYLLPHGGPPPESVTNVFEAIRFVSLLPFVTDVMMWGDKDVWSTNAELLAERAGDYEELALLLVHFLRHLAPDRASYIVVGAGEIFEQTIMVLHQFQDAPQWRLIDPRTGWVSEVERPYGTVFKDVHFVVSHNQLWANLQLSGLPHRMNWDLALTQYWMPCFTVPGGAELGTRTVSHDVAYARAQFDAVFSPIQRVNLDFTAPDRARAGEIAIELRGAVNTALTAWRHHVLPTFHRGVEGVLVELLHVAEQERCQSGTLRDPAVSALAQDKLQEWFGEPLSLAATTTMRRQQKQRPREESDSPAGDGGGGGDARQTAPHLMSDGGRRQERTCLHVVGSPAMSSYNPKDPHFHHLIQQVFETAVHEVGTDDVSFAIGVYVKSYTADVFAMWAFVTAIYRGVQIIRIEDEEDAS